jgi:hypothetical protein
MAASESAIANSDLLVDTNDNLDSNINLKGPGPRRGRRGPLWLNGTRTPSRARAQGTGLPLAGALWVDAWAS